MNTKLLSKASSKIRITGVALFFVLLFALLLISTNANSKTDGILQCQYDDYTHVLPGDLPNQQNLNWQRNKKQYLSPYKLNQQINNGLNKYTVIDVRPKLLFNDYHIRGAFNLPKSKLITKSLFKTKNIVLVGQGNDYKYLENLQEKLTSKDFK